MLDPFRANTHGFENPRTGLGMPSFNSAPELVACVEYAIIPVLILNRPSDAVSCHALCQMGKMMGRIVEKKLRGGGRVAFRAIRVLRGLEVEEFELGCTELASSAWTHPGFALEAHLLPLLHIPSLPALPTFC